MRWIWSVGDESGQGEVVEGGVYASGRRTGAGGASEHEDESLSVVTADFEAVAAAGRWVGPGNGAELEVGFAGVV